MPFKTGEYNLPDIQIIKQEDYPDYKLFSWIPDRIYIILGAANQAEKSVILKNAEKDKVLILKRPSGGESVILTPNTLVISTFVRENQLTAPKGYFEKINNQIIGILSLAGIKNMHQKGISDISIGEKKILGSAIYRKSGKLFYHAVLNVRENPQFISRYLLHPQREPDYRKGRSHAEFVTSLNEQGYNISPEEICAIIRETNK